CCPATARRQRLARSVSQIRFCNKGSSALAVIDRYSRLYRADLSALALAKADHHGISLRSRRNFPVNLCGASLASHTIVSAPSSTERVAFPPPMSVRTQPGQTALTANFGNAATSCDVTPFSAAFEML